MIQSCLVSLSGLGLSCDSSIGGIKRVMIANSGDVEAYKIVDDEIVEIVMVGDAKFKQYQFKRNTGTMTSTLTVTDAGASYVETSVSLVFNKMDTAKRIEMAALSVGEFVLIVEDANGKFWYCGADYPAAASEGAGESGTAFSDRNSYSITLSCVSWTYPAEIRTTPATTGGEYVDLSEIVE